VGRHVVIASNEIVYVLAVVRIGDGVVTNFNAELAATDEPTHHINVLDYFFFIEEKRERRETDRFQLSAWVRAPFTASRVLFE
jgi:acetyltransferase-like isoleucine patch superfamily enzyme